MLCWVMQSFDLLHKGMCRMWMLPFILEILTSYFEWWKHNTWLLIVYVSRWLKHIISNVYSHTWYLYLIRVFLSWILSRIWIVGLVLQLPVSEYSVSTKPSLHYLISIFLWSDDVENPYLLYFWCVKWWKLLYDTSD